MAIDHEGIHGRHLWLPDYSGQSHRDYKGKSIMVQWFDGLYQRAGMSNNDLDKFSYLQSIPDLSFCCVLLVLLLVCSRTCVFHVNRKDGSD